MCLDTVISTDEEFDGVGYKVIKVDNEIPYLRWRPFKFNKWYTAKEQTLTANDKKEYTSGFHIFLSKKAAREYSASNLVLVSFKKAHTIGTQGGVVVIARQIKIEKVLERYNHNLQRWVRKR